MGRKQDVLVRYETGPPGPQGPQGEPGAPGGFWLAVSEDVEVPVGGDSRLLFVSETLSLELFEPAVVKIESNVVAGPGAPEFAALPGTLFVDTASGAFFANDGPELSWRRLPGAAAELAALRREVASLRREVAALTASRAARAEGDPPADLAALSAARAARAEGAVAERNSGSAPWRTSESGYSPLPGMEGTSISEGNPPCRPRARPGF